MGWTLRRGLKLGPTRINLSSRGIGASVGVRGLRFGVSGSGRTYFRGGRGMLRYERTVASSRVGVPASGPLAGESPASTGPTLLGCLLGLAVLCSPIVLLIVASVRGAAGVVVGVVWVAVVIALAATLAARAKRRKREEEERQRAVAALTDAVDRLIQSPKPTEEDARRVALQRQQLAALPTGAAEAYEALYRDAVAASVADQKVTPEERSRLSLLARGLGLSPDFVKAENLAGFMAGFCALIADGRLTEDEDEKLATLREAFEIPEEQIRAPLKNADQLRRARRIEQAAELPKVETGLSLKKGEACFYSAPASELRHYVEDGFRPVKDGTLYVTNQRLLFVGDGATSIKLPKILQLTVELKREADGVIAAIIDGRKTPYYIETPEPFVLTAYLSRAARESSRG